jgi:hypothetical protein
MRKGVSVVGAAIVLLVLLVIGTSLYTGDIPLSSGSQYNDYEQFIDDEFAQYEGVATVNRVVDPWTLEAPEYQPAAGHRFVAIEVTIENPSDRSETVWADADGFKLTDADRFAYAPAPLRMRTELPEVELDPGEKANGWVVFEVDEHSGLKSLSYWTADIELPR